MILDDQSLWSWRRVLTSFSCAVWMMSRQTFVKGLEPFVKWLEEAEEED